MIANTYGRKLIPASLLLLATLLSAASALAQECTLEVGVGDNLNFSTTELSVSRAACSTLTVNLTHSGSLPRQAMGHNWALTLAADAEAVAQAGWQAGLDNQYMPVDDERVIATTDIIGGGEATSITFPLDGLEVGVDYTYFCSFVGHFAVMKGAFVVTE